MNSVIKWFAAWFALGIILLMAACSAPETATPTPSPTPGITLTPFFPAEPVPIITATQRPASSPTPPPTPTPTPFLYKIVEGDTLIGVAFRFGITLAELLAANPGIDPQFLTIGVELIIPLPENPGTAGALPTPVDTIFLVGTPVCYPAKDDSLWCFALFENVGDQTVENISAQVSIYGREGDLLASKIGITPGNLIPPGEKLPVLAWFSGFGPSFKQANAVLNSAIPVLEDDPRYMSVDSEYSAALNGASANIQGTVSGAFSEARISITALGPGMQVLGVRVLILNGETEGAFSTDVFSLGGEIESVLVLVEAYP